MRRWVQIAAIALALPLLLGAKGCELGSPITTVKVVCPNIKRYTPEEQKRMAEQARAVLPILREKAPDLLRLIGDARSVRRAIDQCLAQKSGTQ